MKSTTAKTRPPLPRTTRRSAKRATSQCILAFNVGSSSVRLAVVSAGTFQEVFRMHAEITDPKRAIGEVVRAGKTIKTLKIRHTENLNDVMHQMLVAAVDVRPTLLTDTIAVGHRFVHGGEAHIRPAKLTPKLYEELLELEHLAPLHHPYQLAGMTAAVAFFPKAAQFAVFDTAFYKSLRPNVFLYALPYEYYEHYGLRRFGFHGISHEYLLHAAAQKLHKPVAKLNLVTCHLGGGSSLTAMRNGVPIDTSMGFSPVEGLTMSTRCGDIDPMVVLALLDDLHMSSQDVADLLNFESGLKGVSGFSSDLRDIMATAGFEAVGGIKARKKTFQERARLALDMYVYDIQRYLASYVGLLGRVDAIVFSGAAGSSNPTLRRLILAGVPITKGIKILTIPTNEELHIARTWPHVK